MITSCPCPNPPGGGVICASNQFAYCHRINGALRSGCVAIAGPSERPSQYTVSIHFNSAMEVAGIPKWWRSFEVVRLGGTSESPSLGPGLGEFGGNVGALLYEGMDSGRFVILRGVESQLFLMRFPSIWLGYRQSPEPNFGGAF